MFLLEIRFVLNKVINNEFKFFFGLKIVIFLGILIGEIFVTLYQERYFFCIVFVILNSIKFYKFFYSDSFISLDSFMFSGVQDIFLEISEVVRRFYFVIGSMRNINNLKSFCKYYIDIYVGRIYL